MRCAAKTILYSAVAVLALLPGQASFAINRSHFDGTWITYMDDDQHSGFAVEESIITPETAPTLTTRWTVATAASVSDQPTTWNGHLYYGTWDGYEHSATLFGRSLWQTFVGKTVNHNCDPSKVGVASSATVVSNITVGNANLPVVYVGGGNAYLYALNADTGSVIWKTHLGSHGSAFLWSSPMIDGDQLFMDVSSFGDCPLVRGKIVKLNASTGAIERIFWTAPPGCTGNGVWGSPTLDSSLHEVYFVTGNDGDCDRKERLNESVVAVTESDLSLVGKWSVPKSQQGVDSDFGSTPTVFQANSSGRPITAIGVVNKNGYYYAFNDNDIAAGPIWEDHIGIGGLDPQDGSADISPSSWTGTQLYVASGNTFVHGSGCEGSIREVNPETGHYLWQDCLDAPVLGAVQTMPGLVEVAAGSEVIVANSATGQVLYDGTFAGAQFWGPAAVSAGSIYQGDMSGHLYAITPSSAF